MPPPPFCYQYMGGNAVNYIIYAAKSLSKRVVQYHKSYLLDMHVIRLRFPHIWYMIKANLDGGDSMQEKRRNYKRTIIKLLLAGFVLYLFPIYHIGAMVPYFDYYSKEEIAMLAFRGGPVDHLQAMPVLKLAEEAFSDVDSTKEEAIQKYGLLYRYGFTEDISPDVVSETHSLKLWSCRFYNSKGYMWVYYSHEAYNTGDEVTSGSTRVQALWTLEKNTAGDWVVNHIKEHA